MIYADISWIYNHVLVALLSSSVDNYDNRVRRGISTTRLTKTSATIGHT